MSSLLVVQPDSLQVETLLESLRAYISENIVVVESLEDALCSIDRGVPDVMLLPTLTPAATEDYLIAYLGSIPAARHVQILGLPHLERFDNSVQPRDRSVFPWRWRRRTGGAGSQSCDSGLFTKDVVTYLAGARALKEQNELCSAHAALRGMPERRREPRLANSEVPWISLVRLASERAVLINVSSRGALLRTQTRPEHRFLRRSEPEARPGLTLELASQGEVHVIGRIIRCVPLKANARTEYEIAFAFDDSLGLHLPTAGCLVPINGYCRFIERTERERPSDPARHDAGDGRLEVPGRATKGALPRVVPL